MYNLIRTAGIAVWCIGLAAAIYLMFQLSVPYTSFQKNIDFLATKQNVYHIDYWRYAFYAHVFTSIFVLPSGFTQFNSSFFAKAWHRKLGMIYILTVLFIKPLLIIRWAIIMFGTQLSQAVVTYTSCGRTRISNKSKLNAIKRNVMADKVSA